MKAHSFELIRHRLGFALGLVLAATATVRAAKWEAVKGTGEDLPGQNVTVTADGRLVARFIYGDGQNTPYLAIYDEQGRLLTNAGLDKAGKTVGIEPHHRGIFIGWQRVKSDLGTSNLWGMGAAARTKAGEKAAPAESATMRVAAIESLASDANSATIVARVEWRAGAKDAAGSNLLLTETRTLRVSRPRWAWPRRWMRGSS